MTKLDNQLCPVCGGDSWKHNTIQTEEKHCKCGADFYLKNVMKPQDLRIGNYVYYEHTTHIISGIIGNKIYSWWVKDGKPVIEYEQKDVGGAQVENPYMDVISRYDPIPLTDAHFIEWGFYKDGEYWGRGIEDYNFCFKYRDWAKNWAFYQEFTDSPFEHDEGVKYPISFDIEFVHQIQNLWFALLHKEINEKEE